MKDKRSTLSGFKSEAGKQLFMQAYDELLTCWPTVYETKSISTHFGQCHVMISGPEAGQPILMLHGMTTNSAFWFPTVEILKDYRVYCIDTPGDIGKSVVSQSIRSREDVVLWINQVLDALQLHKAIIIGHSMGGWLAAHYATQRPERIKQLILLAPIATFLPPPYFALMRKIYPALLWPNPKRIRKAWAWFCSKGYTLPEPVMNVIISAYTHGKILLHVMPDVIKKEAWSKVQCPVLFVVGAEEKIYNAKIAMRRAKEMIDHAEVVEIENAGHCLLLEQKQVVNSTLAAFLEK